MTTTSQAAASGAQASEEDWRAACAGNGCPDADEFAAWGFSLPGAPAPGSPGAWSYLLRLLGDQLLDQLLDEIMGQ